jgi:hypothetical protein
MKAWKYRNREQNDNIEYMKNQVQSYVLSKVPMQSLFHGPRARLEDLEHSIKYFIGAVCMRIAFATTSL